MKIRKGKYIRLTESQLTELIKNEVSKQLQLLMEYAVPQAKFVDNAYNLSSQIVENWSLVHYCTLTGREETKRHWAKELYAHMNNVSQTLIKKNNSYDNRLTAIREGFNMNDLYSSVDRIIRLTTAKFDIEEIPTNTQEYTKCVEDCFNAIDDIADAIAKFDPTTITEYIKGI